MANRAADASGQLEETKEFKAGLPKQNAPDCISCVDNYDRKLASQSADFVADLGSQTTDSARRKAAKENILASQGVNSEGEEKLSNVYTACTGQDSNQASPGKARDY